MIDTVTNPEESREYYDKKIKFFSQKKEDSPNEYRQKFIQVVIDQEEELNTQLMALDSDLQQIVKDNSDKQAIDSKITKPIDLFFKFFPVLIIVKNTQASKINGDWQIQEISDKYKGLYTADITKSVVNTTQTIGKTILHRKNRFDGITVGQRIVTLEGSTLKTARNIIHVGFEEGVSAKQMADNLSRFIIRDLDNPTPSPYQYYRDRFGYKIKKAPTGIRAGTLEYQTERIARTEINNTWREATLRSNRDKPWVESYSWNLSSAHPKKDICDDWAAGGPYKYEEISTFGHPFDMCYITTNYKNV